MAYEWWLNRTKHDPPSEIEQIMLDGLRELTQSNELCMMDSRPQNVDRIFLHCTATPARAGREPWLQHQAYHRGERGWSDIGYHIGVSKDETIWLLRPISRRGAHVKYHNTGTIGVAMDGNYDIGHDDPDLIVPTAAKVIVILCEWIGVSKQSVHFHREYASKTCPGTAVHRRDFRERVAQQSGQTLSDSIGEPNDSADLRLYNADGDEYIDANQRLQDGTTRADVRPLLEELGYSVGWNEEKKRVEIMQREDIDAT